MVQKALPKQLFHGHDQERKLVHPCLVRPRDDDDRDRDDDVLLVASSPADEGEGRRHVTCMPALVDADLDLVAPTGKGASCINQGGTAPLQESEPIHSSCREGTC